MTRVVLLYSEAGAGHKQSAEAIASALVAQCPQAQVCVHNPTTQMPFPFSGFPLLYRLLVEHAPKVYGALFRLGEEAYVQQLLGRIFAAAFRATAGAIAHQAPADLYISTYPLFSKFLFPHLAAQCSRAKRVTVVTDLLGHQIWHSPYADLCIVPTHFARDEALKYGVLSKKVQVGGQPVGPDFAQRMSRRETARAHFGLQLHRPLVLMMGGGEGMGRMELFARALAQSALQIQLVVVCGRNEKLRARVQAIQPTGSSVTALGFTHHVPELMGAADVLLTKAGPGTLAEGFIAGLPILLYDAIPGQEEGNIDYVVKHGAGQYCPTPEHAVQALERGFADPAGFGAFQRASLSLAQPTSACAIARLALETLG